MLCSYERTCPISTPSSPGLIIIQPTDPERMFLMPLRRGCWYPSVSAGSRVLRHKSSISFHVCVRHSVQQDHIRKQRIEEIDNVRTYRSTSSLTVSPFRVSLGVICVSILRISGERDQLTYQVALLPLQTWSPRHTTNPTRYLMPGLIRNVSTSIL